MNEEIIVGDTSPEGLEKNIRGAGKILEALIKQNFNYYSRTAYSHLLSAVEFGVMGNSLSLSEEDMAPCKPKWTSILDALPDNHIAVLALDSRGYQSVCFRVNRVWRYYGCHDECCNCENGNVTHWMELPCVQMTK